ncbi:MAG: peptidoglycan-binding protein [Candidatus Omnitrophica bacterium]|nr:peptidoglycan-binding protein [Candidatus Omnitrophota bacterium]
MRKLIFFLIVLILLVSGCKGKKESAEEEVENIQVVEPLQHEETQTTPARNLKNKAVTSVKNQPLQNKIPDRPTIKDIQIALKNASLYNGKIDGIAGPKTKKAIEEFQAKNGLVVDGKVGPKTWEKLKIYYNASNATSVEITN